MIDFNLSFNFLGFMVGLVGAILAVFGKTRKIRLFGIGGLLVGIFVDRVASHYLHFPVWVIWDNKTIETYRNVTGFFPILSAFPVITLISLSSLLWIMARARKDSKESK